MREEPRRRVRLAADELGFQPNSAALALNSGRTYTVGMITTDTIGRFSIPLMTGAEDALGAGRTSVFLCDARDGPIREQYYPRTLLSRRVDGIIATGRRTQARTPSAWTCPSPWSTRSSAPPTPTTARSSRAKPAAPARPSTTCSPSADDGSPTSPDPSTTTRYGFAPTPRPLDSPRKKLALVGAPMFGEWSETRGRQAAGILMGTADHFDAVFCGSDQIARGVADALHTAGRRVPDDVALVGFDNWDVMTLACQPALTSVDMELEHLGRTAANLLLTAINGEPAPGRHLNPCRLVVRDSTTVPIDRA